MSYHNSISCNSGNISHDAERSCLYPVTALLHCGQHILVGRGSYLDVYSLRLACLASSWKALAYQSVQGITSLQLQDTTYAVLLWGGHQACLLLICLGQDSDSPVSIELLSAFPEFEDRILHASFHPAEESAPAPDVQLVFVSAHNAIWSATCRDVAPRAKDSLR